MAMFPEGGPRDLRKRLMLDHVSPEDEGNVVNNNGSDFCCAVRLFDEDNSEDSAVSMTTVSTPDGSFETNFDLLQTPAKKSDGNNDSFVGWDANLETPHSKLSFCISPESMCISPPSKQAITLSPITSPSVAAASPRRLEYKLNCLQLFDSPHTPKSIIRRSSFTRLQRTANRTPYSTNSCSRLHMTSNGRSIRKYKSKGTNINPFTPTEIRHKAKGNKINTLDSTKEEVMLTNSGHKRLALRDSNISRYNAEFHEVCKIGTGSFGTVYKCINRLDGCVYAVKKSLKPVAGSVDEGTALREVYAHAVLGSHPHLVRYYSAWAEDDHMIIQNEFCNGGNLSRKIVRNNEHNKVFSEMELYVLLRQVAEGLQYIHSMDLVHLDIKPENIFITYPEPTGTPPPGSCDTIFEEEREVKRTLQGEVHGNTAEDVLLYKIGDMGHVTSIVDPLVEEGDCRYMCRELLQENFLHLPKADIFSLALTVYVSGGGGELPKNGSSWHSIRDGILSDLPQCSREFNTLLKAMIIPDPVKRPSAAQLLAHPTICSTTEKSKEQLRKELNEEKFKNQMLSRELQVAQQQTRSRKVNRSLSVGNIH